MEIIIKHNYFKQLSKDEHGETNNLGLSESPTPTAPSDWYVFLIPKKNRLIRVNRSGVGLHWPRSMLMIHSKRSGSEESFIRESNDTDHR